MGPLIPIIIIIVCLMACHNSERAAEVLRTQFLQDSVREMRMRDSLRRTNMTQMFAGELRLLGEPSIEKSPYECYRVLVEFSWGNSPAGSHLAVRVSADDGHPHVTVTSVDVSGLTDTLRVEKEISRKEFLHISNLFDSMDFPRLPVVVETDGRVYDANRYFVEQSRAGKYHVISRSGKVDRFIYHYLTTALKLASVDKPELIKEFEGLEAAGKQAH